MNVAINYPATTSGKDTSISLFGHFVSLRSTWSVGFKGTYMNFIMSNTTFFARGSIHQGNDRFSNVSRGRQCAFMSLSALLCANSCDILTWTSDTIDGIVIEGDAMYLKAFKERSIPDTETISLNYLPVKVHSIESQPNHINKIDI